MWEILEKDEPLFVGMSPPCTPFTQLQNLTPNPDPLEKARQLIEGRLLFRLCAQVVEYQLARGRHFYLEQPRGAMSWNEPCIKNLVYRDDVFVGELGGCMFDFKNRISGLPCHKPFRIITSSAGLAYRLTRRCDKSH